MNGRFSPGCRWPRCASNKAAPSVTSSLPRQIAPPLLRQSNHADEDGRAGRCELLQGAHRGFRAGAAVSCRHALLSGAAGDTGAGLARADAVPARPRPHRAREGVPPPQAQDPGVHLAGGRSLPDAAHAHARDDRDRAHGCTCARAERGPDGGDRAGSRFGTSPVRTHRRGGARQQPSGALQPALSPQPPLPADRRAARAGRRGAESDRRGPRRDPAPHVVGARARHARGPDPAARRPNRLHQPRHRRRDPGGGAAWRGPAARRDRAARRHWVAADRHARARCDRAVRGVGRDRAGGRGGGGDDEPAHVHVRERVPGRIGQERASADREDDPPAVRPLRGAPARADDARRVGGRADSRLAGRDDGALRDPRVLGSRGATGLLMRYSAESKDRVRDAFDFQGLVAERTDLRRVGTQLVGLCPFHDERSPSFSIDPVKKVYYCFGCGERGDVFSYVQKTHGLDFVQALEFLAYRAHVELEREQDNPEEERRRAAQDRLLSLLNRAAQFYSAYLWKADEAANAREYLAERGLEKEVLERFHVGYAPVAGDKLIQQAAKAGFSADDLVAAGLARRRGGRVDDGFRARIIFPLANQRGHVFAFAGRARRPYDKPKYLNTAENEAVGVVKGDLLYGRHEARAAAMKTGRFVVVEGYTDVLALHQAGVPECVAIMGTSLTDRQLEELTKVQGTVFLALDADNAAKTAPRGAARMPSKRQTDLRVVAMPAGRDPAEIVTQDGAEAFRSLLDSALNVWSFQLARLLEQADLASAEGRDRAFEPALAVIRDAPLLVREELIRDAASGLSVEPAVVANALGSQRRASVQVDAEVRPVRTAAPISQAERAEIVFLSLCLGLGERGMKYLERSAPEHFSTDLMREARKHLLTHTGDPLAGLGEGHTSLASVVMEMVQLADEGDEQALRLSYLQLELRRVGRDLRTAEQRSDYERQRHLWGERESVRGEISELMGQTA